MAQTAARIDPLRSFNFRVEIDNMTLASFSEVSGLTADGDMVEYREGTDSANHVRKYAALATGAAGSRRNGTIVLQDDTHADAVYFQFTNGFLNKIVGPDLKASGN